MLIIHTSAITQLLNAMQLLTALVVFKCSAHQESNTAVAHRKNYADNLVKEVIICTCFV